MLQPSAWTDSDSSHILLRIEIDLRPRVSTLKDADVGLLFYMDPLGLIGLIHTLYPVLLWD